jgi:hypothetical protein
VSFRDSSSCPHLRERSQTHSGQRALNRFLAECLKRTGLLQWPPKLPHLVLHLRERSIPSYARASWLVAPWVTEDRRRLAGMA